MRGLVRLLIVVLAVGIGAGSSLLDGCLVSCHSSATAKNARTGHCHTVVSTETGAAHIASIPHCCHDGFSGLADTETHSIRTVVPVLLFAVSPAANDSLVVAFRPAVGRTLDRSHFDPAQIPLRL